MDKRKKLATLSVMYQGDWDKIAKALQDDVQAIDIPIKDSYITIYDSEYPDSLRKITLSSMGFILLWKYFVVA